MSPVAPPAGKTADTDAPRFVGDLCDIDAAAAGVVTST